MFSVATRLRRTLVLVTLGARQMRPSAWTGRVVACETGVAVVETANGQVRATYSARMLSRLARDRGYAAQAGDRVVLRRWPDDRVTIEDVEREPGPAADVIALRPLR